MKFATKTTLFKNLLRSRPRPRLRRYKKKPEDTEELASATTVSEHSTEPSYGEDEVIEPTIKLEEQLARNEHEEEIVASTAGNHDTEQDSNDAEARAMRALLELHEREVAAVEELTTQMTPLQLEKIKLVQAHVRRFLTAREKARQREAAELLALEEEARASQAEAMALLALEEEEKAKAREANLLLARRSKLHVETERKVALRSTLKHIGKSEQTDLCFMVDATGSMSSHIEGVKSQINQIAKDVKRTNAALKLRVAIVGYRDAVDVRGDVNSPFDFTDNLTTFVNHVSTIEASGGGDECEDVASGLRDVLSFSWASPTRVLFFIADAPAHGERYHAGGGSGDNHRSSDHGVPELLRQIKAMHVDVVHCSINQNTGRMIESMNADVGDHRFITTLPMSDPRLLTAHATKTLRQSMQKTLTRTMTKSMTASRAGGNSGSRTFGIHLVKGSPATTSERDTHETVRGFTLTTSEPMWPSVAALRATIYSDESVDVSALRSPAPLHLGGLREVVAATANISKVASVKSLLRGKRASATAGTGQASQESQTKPSTPRSLVCTTRQIKVAPEPFAHGNVRFARWGRIMDAGPDEPWRPCIFKDFKTTDVRQHALEEYLVEMEVNAVASALAKEFNRAACPPAHRRMRYVLASVASVETGEDDGEPRHFFVEEPLDGAFTRYSYNSGYWEEDLLCEWLLRFALWTYKVTNGFLMVTDLQGILTDGGYILTDPVILCTDLQRFGSTNLGKEMMERCKSSTERHLETVTGSAKLSFGLAPSNPPAPRKGPAGLSTFAEEDEDEEW